MFQRKWIVGTSAALLIILLALPARGALIDRVNEAFRTIHGRSPSYNEWEYWAGRVQRKEKTSFAALVGAIAFQRAHSGKTIAPATEAPSVAGSSSFTVNRALYASPHNPNFLPEGTLVKGISSPEIFYIVGGKKSWVIPSIANRWLGENHYYKHDLVIAIPDADLARYPQTRSVNPLYIGKVLQHPNGTQFYIDDKLRKRPLSPSVRKALKFPSGNLYPTSDIHLREFKTGPAITRTDIQPGGMVVYHGPWHGGRIWRIEEDTNGKLVKRLFLTDYLYEAYYYPDESQRVPVSAEELARYPRASNIERYPDGWVVGIGTNVYVVQNEQLRLVSTPQIFSAMGHNPKYVLRIFPEFLRRYPKGNTIAAFKTVLAPNANGLKATTVAAPSAASNLTKVRPAIRTLISQVNDIYLSVYDKDVTASENKFWVDYLYNGEVSTKAELVAAMQRAKTTGRKPARTSRIATLPESTLESKWFPYLFYFVHLKEPNDAERNYWYSRIKPGDRDSIEKLGGTIQWLKDTAGKTHK